MSGGPIEASADGAFPALAARLVQRARLLAAARARAAALAAAGDARRWRRADLIWPLFAER